MKPMLATQYEQARVKFPCLVQPKYDGVRCIICLVDDEVHLLSRNGKDYNVPHIKKWAEEHKELLPLDGELFTRKLTFQQICSAVKCYSTLTDNIEYVVYDKPISKPFDERHSILMDQIRYSGYVYLSTWDICYSHKEIDEYHDLMVGLGYEGAIIRNMHSLYIDGRSNDLMKLKKFDTNEFEIVDVIEASGLDKGTAIFKLRAGENLFHARPVGSKSLRSQYLRDKDNLIGKYCTIQHQGYSDSKVPRFPVALTIRDYE